MRRATCWTVVHGPNLYRTGQGDYREGGGAQGSHHGRFRNAAVNLDALSQALTGGAIAAGGGDATSGMGWSYLAVARPGEGQMIFGVGPGRILDDPARGPRVRQLWPDTWLRRHGTGAPNWTDVAGSRGRGASASSVAADGRSRATKHVPVGIAALGKLDLVMPHPMWSDPRCGHLFFFCAHIAPAVPVAVPS